MGKFHNFMEKFKNKSSDDASLLDIPAEFEQKIEMLINKGDINDKKIFKLIDNKDLARLDFDISKYAFEIIKLSLISKRIIR